MRPSKARYFRSAGEFRDWLRSHGERLFELVVGIYKKTSGKGGISYQEALDEALCFGWIDGVRRSFGPDSYSVRFSPRTRRSIWSRINVRRAEELRNLGRMTAAGLRAFEARDPKRSRVYSFENPPQRLEPALEAEFRSRADAWTYFQSRAPWYRRTATWWVMSAKKEETRRKRLATLIDDSTHQRLIGLLRRPGVNGTAEKKKGRVRLNV